jgi:SAM-dependent methyltransferase
VLRQDAAMSEHAAPPAEGRAGHWFEPIADHLGSAYLRYSFTKGTEQEVGFLVDVLGLAAGQRVLDVGCGPGRHAHALARRGLLVHGVDISERFVDLARASAPPGATFERADARSLRFDGTFDAAISLCQGGFGLVLDDESDLAVLAGMRAAVRPGGWVVCSAFSAYFLIRHEAPGVFDAGRGVNHERTVVKDESGRDAEVDLWTSCYTPRELRLLVTAAGLEPVSIWSVEPGDYARRAPGVDLAEFLVVARRPEVVAGPS